MTARQMAFVTQVHNSAKLLAISREIKLTLRIALNPKVGLN